MAQFDTDRGASMDGLGKGASGVTSKTTFARVLCAVDGKPGGFEAISQAAALCGPGGHLTILVVTSARVAGDIRSPEIGPARATEIIDRASELAEQAGVAATIEVEPATPPARVVLEWAEDHDLIALGAPGGSWLGGLLIQGVGDAAIRSFNTPLLAARAKDEQAPDLYKHLVIASDGLPDSDRPVEIAGEIARGHGSRVTLLHALGHSRPDVREHVKRQSDALVSAGCEQPEMLVLQGNPAHVLPAAIASLSPSLLVVGTRRRAGLRAIGSVSGHLVHEAPCSVLLVPPPVDTADGR